MPKMQACFAARHLRCSLAELAVMPTAPVSWRELSKGTF